jgi:hypothetical protein
MGKLSSEECARFEEHFVDCSRCLDQLQTTHDFTQALKSVAAEDATQPRPVSAPISGFKLIVFSWRPALIAAAACLAVFSIPGLVLLRQARLAHAEVDQANAAAESWHRQYVAEQQTSAQLEKQLHEQTAQQNRTTVGPAAALPVAASLLFTLETTRGGEPVGAEPVNQIAISRSASSVTLSVNQEDLEESTGYHATLADSHGRILGQLDHIQPSTGIVVPVSLLHPGDYLLTLQGRARQGGVAVSRAYPFRVKFKQ